eukprot:363250-Chlamydomonas_euryale.AAC.9
MSRKPDTRPSRNGESPTKPEHATRRDTALEVALMGLVSHRRPVSVPRTPASPGATRPVLSLPPTLSLPTLSPPNGLPVL